MEKGIFTLEQEKILTEKLDEVIKLKGILEIIDGYVFKAIITFVDDTYADRIKEDIKVRLALLADAVIKEDITESERLAASLINYLVDIPGLDEDAEGLLFKGTIEILVGAILRWIEKQKQEPVRLKIWEEVYTLFNSGNGLAYGVPPSPSV